jgi:hypothetical protein
MPRKDRTFNDKDVIRIIVKHLTAKEALEVAIFLDENIKDVLEGKLKPINNILLDILKFRDIIQPLLDSIQFIPVVGSVVDVINLIFDLIEQAIIETET